MGVSSLRCWGICKLLLKWNLNHKGYIFLVETKCVQYSIYFWFVFGMISCLSRFFFLSFFKKMYNCIILFISFYFVPLEKKVKSFFFCLFVFFCWNCKIICLGFGPGFCSLLQLSFLAIVIYSCTITPRRCVQGPFPSLCVWRALSCIKIGNGLRQVVYTRACMQAHMKTLTHKLSTVTKITTALTGFTNTDNKGLQPTSQWPGIWKSVLQV